MSQTPQTPSERIQETIRGLQESLLVCLPKDREDIETMLDYYEDLLGTIEDGVDEAQEL